MGEKQNTFPVSPAEQQAHLEFSMHFLVHVMLELVRYFFPTVCKKYVFRRKKKEKDKIT